VTSRALVVGAAVVRDGRLLAARRTTPAEAAGRWELPGGKVDEGETPDEAVVREIREELGCEVTLDRWLTGDQPIGAAYALRVAVCTLADGEPAPLTDHDLLLWLAADDLDGLDWLEPDRPFLPDLRTALLGSEA
jgi:8-oxo-dGTP diphosphatase